MARRSCALIARMFDHGIGGRVSSALAFATHCASVIVSIYCRRLTGYVVPQGPRQPRRSPVSQSFSGTLPLLGKYPAVWQSLQPPMTTRYFPRASELASAFAPGSFAASAACTVHGSAAAKKVAINGAAKLNLMLIPLCHRQDCESKAVTRSDPGDGARTIHRKDATPSAA